MVEGYCCNWISDEKNKSDVYDITIPEYDFKMSWNLGNSNTWSIDNNLRYENGNIVTDYTERAKTDKSLKRHW